MQFSDTSTYQGIIQHIDFLLYGDGTTFNASYALADRVRNVNIEYDETVADLFKADPNFIWDDVTNTTYPIACTDMVANRDNYTIPDSALVVHSLRMFDRNGQLKTLIPKQRREFTDSELAETGEPSYYYKIDNGFFPVPVPDYGGTDGVEFLIQREATHFTAADTTKEPGFASIFHHRLSVGAALAYALANGMSDKSNMLMTMKEQIRNEMKVHYQRRAPDRKPSVSLKRRNTNRYALS